MSNNNNTNERDSYWKSPLLKQGEYDVLAMEMNAHVISIDAQCWRIFMCGDEKINMNVAEKEVEKPLASYKEADFKVVGKNFQGFEVCYEWTRSL